MSLNALFLLPMLAASPYGSIDTREIPAADIKLSQVYIKAVDGKAYFDHPLEMKVTPGLHWIEMTRQESSKVRSKKGDDQPLYIVVKPCTRYYVAGGGEAGDNNNNDPKFNRSWKVVVRKEERILDCKTKEEIEQEQAEKKAKKANKAKVAKDASVGGVAPESQNTETLPLKN